MVLRAVPFIQQKLLSKCWILQGAPTPLCCFGEAEQLTALACFMLLCVPGALQRALMHFLLQNPGHANGRCKNRHSHLGLGNRNNHAQESSRDLEWTLKGTELTIS